MALTLYAHPFSSYCQKALIAFYENGVPFELRLLAGEAAMAELAGLWPLKRFPVLVDDGRTIAESSVIIEHLGLFHPGPLRLVPEDPKAALEVRFLDRFFDNYVMNAATIPVFEALRTEGGRKELAMAEARQALDTAYAWLERMLANRQWAAGDAFSLADCAAAPSLFYADWVHQIGENFPNVRAYRSRLLARPSFARAVEEARPYRPLFPLGAPDRD
ncbi:MAG: Glutathione S-transferase, N-terminal domain [uncultured Microvirga sp.]|uniref:Glutathione S-transferase, N-terminal domain n=1 Tax=uncultured Microvirga sp. TaxID=412392 RepID=A0A6J4M5B6_9HYPH|nr:MAG: Glutathione S-transferase, N-terminal domain [uncultured Microvirga sp.]